MVNIPQNGHVEAVDAVAAQQGSDNSVTAAETLMTPAEREALVQEQIAISLQLAQAEARYHGSYGRLLHK